jgi:sugar lactone lactonase YvrE
MSMRRSLSCLAAFAFAPILCQAQGYVTTTVAGRARAQHAPGASESLHILGPGALALDSSGNQFIAVKDGVFEVDASGTPTRIAGTQREWRYSGDGGPAIGARLNPHGVALDAAGNLYLADSGNNRIRKVAAATGVITTVAGNGLKGFSGDGGPAVGAELDGPTGVALDAAGNLYVADGIADGNMRIRRVAAATGVITTVAGNGSQGYSGDGVLATSAQLSTLGGLATDASGNLYIADNFNHRIRKVSAATGIITTVAGSGVAGHSGDGGLATSAELNNPLAMAADASGNLYIADSANFRIRKVTASTGTIATLVNGGNDTSLVYSDSQHGFPCAVAVDASGKLYIADFGTSRIRKVPAGAASLSIGGLAATPILTGQVDPSGFTINVTYGETVPSAAQTAFNSLVSTYESVFSSTNITVNITVDFGDTGLGESDTYMVDDSYTSWRTAMLANAAAYPSNTYNAAAAASLPASDPIGLGTVGVHTANARALGLSAFTPVDSTLTFTNSAGIFEYTGVATPGLYDFLDVAAHELDEGLCIGSLLTGLANNASLPTDDYEGEDYYRYSTTPGTRGITTDPTAVVYFSYNGSTDVAQFNQAYSVGGDSDLDRNDWIYGNFGCPAEAPGPYIQDAIGCPDEAVAVGQTGSPEVIVLNSLGFNPGVGTTPQTITFNAIGNVTFGVAPFSISATATSGLTVSFASTTMTVCTVSVTTVTILAGGTCSITASQPGNATYAAAPPVTRSFTVSPAPQTITFNALGNVTFGVAPFSISATATSGLTVSFASTTTTVCTVSGSTVTILAGGTCSITASQPGNTNYAGAPSVTRSFTVGPAPQTITFNALSNVTFGVAPFPISATATSGLTVSFASTTTTVCTVSGSTVTIVGVGTCSITASQAGSANYAAAASVTQSFAVNPAGLQFYPVTPCRLVDTRGAAAGFNGIAPFSGPSIPSGGTLTIPVQSATEASTNTAPAPCGVIPSIAQAYSINVTLIPHAGGPVDYITLWPAGSTQPVVSTLDDPQGLIVSNAAIVPAGAPSGGISVYNAGPSITDVVIDMDGYFGPPADGGPVALQFYPVAPCRLVDTRGAAAGFNGIDPFAGPSILAGGTLTVPVQSATEASTDTTPAPCGVIPSSAQAYSFNLAVVPQAGGPIDYVSLWPAGSTQPFVSTLDDPQGLNVSNAAIVPAGTPNGGVSVYNHGPSTTNVVIDMNGYFAPPASGLQFHPIAPCRLVDTRGAAVGFNGIEPFSGPSIPAGGTVTIPVQSATEASTNTTPAPCGVIPSTAQAYSFNLTVVPVAEGRVNYVSLWPAGSTQPFVSTLDDPEGYTVANAAIVPAGASSGGISVYNAGPAATNVVIDMNGYFAP